MPFKMRNLVLCAAALSAATTVAGAATISRETLSRKLLDACVYRQYQVKEIDRQSMIEKCRCATTSALQSLPGDSFEEPRSGGLTSAQDRAIRTSIAACFTAG